MFYHFLLFFIVMKNTENQYNYLKNTSIINSTMNDEVVIDEINRIKLNYEDEILALKSILKANIIDYEDKIHTLEAIIEANKIDQLCVPCLKQSQSQSHGFIYENEIKGRVFNIKPTPNDKEKHDIDKSVKCKNKEENENISIKTATKTVANSFNICLASIENFYNYDFKDKNTIIVVCLKQEEDKKIIENIYEFNYDKNMHKFLFGSITEEEIKSFINYIKKEGKDASRQDRTKKTNELTYRHGMKITINPKVSKTNCRVQCSVALKTLLKYLKDNNIEIVNSEDKYKNKYTIRGIPIPKSISSSVRK